MNRQEGIEKNLIKLASDIANTMTPGIPASDKAKDVAKLNAAATAKTYDSSKDPSIPGPYIPLLTGFSFVFNHNMGYIPIITIVNKVPGDHLIYITDLTETHCTVFHISPSTTSALIKIFAH